MLFFHQGGLVIMDHLTDNHFCSLLAARCGALVFSLDYRLCPENTFPAPIEDAKALWEHVQACNNDYGVDPTRVALAGNSAGGLISSTLALILRDEGSRQPKALCLASPWVTTNDESQPSLSSCRFIVGKPNGDAGNVLQLAVILQDQQSAGLVAFDALTRYSSGNV